ncbi:hypothetical protein [Psychromonas hadalis]|uniref:hypothetical protein n=1 Tax=Psychromonas hadalis TaxID=211669 RepID=UPI0003B33F8C|nr:hypothetical protein [Psychromonas hadalis]
MQRILFIILVSLFSFSVFAGKITIEKSDSLIRNDVFDEKRERAEEYKRREAERNAENYRWSSSINPSCVLLKNRYLLYFCTSNGRYYKGDESNNRPQYRELSTQEVKKLRREKD